MKIHPPLATQVKQLFIISTTFLKPRNFSFPFLKQKLKVMLTFLEMRKAFKAGGERANKITLSPPRPAIRTDVQAKGVMLLRLNHADYKKLARTHLVPVSETENNHDKKTKKNTA